MDRTILASQIFNEYDADGSGKLDADEFTRLLQAFDPRVKAEGVVKTIEKISGAGQQALDLAGFNQWVSMVFGKASDADFDSGMSMLLATAEATSPRKKRAPSGNSRVDDTWMDMLSSSVCGQDTQFDSNWAKMVSAQNGLC